VRAALVLGLAFAATFGAGSRAGPGLTGDPVRYACVAREMVENGDPTRLTFDGGSTYANKPPLVFWAQAAAMSVAGFTEAAARLPSRVFGVATVALLLFLLASRHGRRAAFAGALVLAVWPTFQRAAATGRLDSALAFFTLAGLAALLHAERRGPTFPRALAVGALFGLAVLSKGPAGLLGPAAALVGSLAAGRGRLLARLAPGALLAFAAVSLPWYALQVAREGDWWQRFRGDLARVDFPKGRGLGVALRVYGEALLVGLPGFVAAAVGLRRLAPRLAARSRRAYAETLLLALLVVLALGIATRPVPYARYLVPGIPALAWFAGVGIALVLRAPGWRRAAVAAVAAVVLVAYPVVVAFGLWPTRDKHGALLAAVRAAREEVPDVRAIPAWPWPFPDGYRAAVCFYGGVRLRPVTPDEPGVPRVLVAFGGRPDAEALRGWRLVDPPLALDRDDRVTVWRLAPAAPEGP
jgi:4-amino-4-deoxy-L-arabinose transferase-like glycosyltransferase